MLHGIAARWLAVSGGTGPPGFRPLKTLLYSPEGGKREGLSFLEANALTGPPDFFGGPKRVGGSDEGGPPVCPPWTFSHFGASFFATNKHFLVEGLLRVLFRTTKALLHGLLTSQGHSGSVWLGIQE